ncbi:MAG: hypothetical protein HRT51_13735 [Colwellia sp.]|nr:hypothetical protein [Colwellia sp.]
MKVKNSLLVVAALLAIFSVNTSFAESKAAEQQHKSDKATKRVPAMRNRVYAQLARAQGLADAGDKSAGFSVLDDVKARLNSLNSYERAMLFNFYGFMYYGNDDITLAINSFKQVIAEKTIPDSLVISTYYSLSQLSMQQQKYSQALEYLTLWKNVNSKALTANQEMLFAQIYYQDKQFIDALIHIENAIYLVEEKNKLPKENWLILKRAAHFELDQPKQVTKVMEQLVRLYDKAQYWLQLSSMYGEIGEEDKQMAVMEAAYQAGYVTKPSDIMTLTQLYLFHGAPFKAADLLNEAIEQGTIIAQEKSLDLLSRAYLAAKEDKQAIRILKKVTQLVDGGKYDAMLAHIYLNNEQWQLAINFAGSAIAKSKHDSKTPYLGNMYLAQGMANYNLQDFIPSLQAFASAQKYPKIKKTAQQWAKYTQREQETFQKQQKIRLAMLN